MGVAFRGEKEHGGFYYGDTGIWEIITGKFVVNRSGNRWCKGEGVGQVDGPMDLRKF